MLYMQLSFRIMLYTNQQTSTSARYYSYSGTCAPIYAYGFKKKILIDKDLQDIYNLDNVQIFNDENDICDAFEKTLNSFYNK